jgi:hypothetical protein
MWSRWRVRFYTALFLAGFIGAAIGLIRLDGWVSHCRREAKRCADRAARWEEHARTYRLIAATGERHARTHPEEAAAVGLSTRRESYLARQAETIAALFREEESWWRCWMEPKQSRDYASELFREPEWSPR